MRGTAWHMRTVRSLRGCLLTLLVCAPAFPQERVSVTSVRTWPMGQVTRVAIETSGAPKWRAERAQNPPRLFFDISNARIALPQGESRTIEVNGPMVQRIRMAMNQATVVRVVLDLNAPVDYEASLLVNPHRLMVELRPAGAPTQAAPPAVETSKTAPIAPPPSITPSPVTPATTPAPEPQPVTAEARPVKVTPADAVVTQKAPPPASPPTLERSAPTVELARQPKPATVNRATGQRSLTRALGLKLGRIVIDAGHGGTDYGTTGVTGLHEKDLVLDVAKRLGALVEQRLGAEVVYTRTEDVFIPLQERTAIANRAKADLFLSIHANSSPAPAVAGPEVFYLSMRGSRAELEVAARENAANGQSIFELESLLQRIAKQEKVEESSDFAGRVQTSLYTESRRTNKAIKNRGVKRAPFVVLVGAKMPSVLAEIGFLTNRREEGMLKRSDYRDKIANALFKGVEQYASTLSQMELAQTGKSE